MEKTCAVTMTASERALYLELDHYLRAQELKMKKTGKSQSDRVRRLNRALGESKYVDIWSSSILSYLLLL